jgi:hypothetical protein
MSSEGKKLLTKLGRNFPAKICFFKKKRSGKGREVGKRRGG